MPELPIPYLKVLVVDDSKTMRNIVKNTLQEGGRRIASLFDFREATNGVEAFDSVCTEEPGLILLDWNMEVMKGIDFLKKLRSDPRFQKVPVIMVTSEAAKYNVIEAISAGANDYIVKPFTGRVELENFYAKIERVIAKGGN